MNGPFLGGINGPFLCEGGINSPFLGDLNCPFPCGIKGPFLGGSGPSCGPPPYRSQAPGHLHYVPGYEWPFSGWYKRPFSV